MTIEIIENGKTRIIEISQSPRGPQGPIGPEGPQGEQGVKGDKPVKGVDYYTPDDVAQIEYAVQVYVDGKGYAKASDVAVDLSKKVSIEPGKSLVSDAEIARLANVTNYDDAGVRAEITQVDGKVDTVKALAELAKALAEGRAKGYVFDTVDAMNAWLADASHKALLHVGDPLYIRAQGVPDYWWDGIQAIQLEAREIDLTGYVKNTDYATDSNGGVVKVSSTWGFEISNGTLYGTTKSTEQYASGGNGIVLSKGTLENIKNSLVRGVGDNYYPSKTALSEGLAGKVNKTEVVNLTAQFDDGTTKTFAIYGSEA